MHVPVAPTSPPVYPGGMQVGSPSRVVPSPPPPAIQPTGDGSAWSYIRQMYRNSPHAAQAVEVQALPTSAGVSEPSLYQHSNAPPYYHWAAGSTAGASTSQSHAGAYPAMAVNTGSGATGAPDGSGRIGSQPNTQPPTQPSRTESARTSHPSLNSTSREETQRLLLESSMSGSRRQQLHSTHGHLRLPTSGISLSTLPDNSTIGGCLLPLKTELLT